MKEYGNEWTEWKKANGVDRDYEETQADGTKLIHYWGYPFEKWLKEQKGIEI